MKQRKFAISEQLFRRYHDLQAEARSGSGSLKDGDLWLLACEELLASTQDPELLSVIFKVVESNTKKTLLGNPELCNSIREKAEEMLCRWSMIVNKDVPRKKTEHRGEVEALRETGELPIISSETACISRPRDKKHRGR